MHNILALAETCRSPRNNNDLNDNRLVTNFFMSHEVGILFKDDLQINPVQEDINFQFSTSVPDL